MPVSKILIQIPPNRAKYLAIRPNAVAPPTPSELRAKQT